MTRQIRSGNDFLFGKRKASPTPYESNRTYLKKLRANTLAVKSEPVVIKTEFESAEHVELRGSSDAIDELKDFEVNLIRDGILG